VKSGSLASMPKSVLSFLLVQTTNYTDIQCRYSMHDTMGIMFMWKM